MGKNKDSYWFTETKKLNDSSSVQLFFTVKHKN